MHHDPACAADHRRSGIRDGRTSCPHLAVPLVDLMPTVLDCLSVGQKILPERKKPQTVVVAGKTLNLFICYAETWMPHSKVIGLHCAP